jgi:hypothetical protein
MFMAGTDTIIWSFDMHSIVIQPPGGEGKFKFKCIIFVSFKILNITHNVYDNYVVNTRFLFNSSSITDFLQAAISLYH